MTLALFQHGFTYWGHDACSFWHLQQTDLTVWICLEFVTRCHWVGYRLWTERESRASLPAIARLILNGNTGGEKASCLVSMGHIWMQLYTKKKHDMYTKEKAHKIPGIQDNLAPYWIVVLNSLTSMLSLCSWQCLVLIQSTIPQQEIFLKTKSASHLPWKMESESETKQQ